MKLLIPHEWRVTPRQARSIQERLRHRVLRRDRLDGVGTVAGVDASYRRREGVTRAAVSLHGLPDLEVCGEAVVTLPTPFPYVPGLLSFREIPAVARALEELGATPDLLVVDGHGIAHPRRFGLACHLGVLADRPTVGVAKSRLVGHHEEVPGERGAWRPLVDGEEVIGAVLRTRSGVRPVYVSTGHRVSLPTAIDLVLRLAPRYRLPEPIRRADRLAGR